ncbi:MAG: nickel-dependent hydrogenase large subunit [Planctomycetota bacterium]
MSCIELLYNAEKVVELLNDPEITSTETRVAVTPRAARGVGCVEAPRGTLIHDYETDENGLITNLNLIVGTTHNRALLILWKWLSVPMIHVCPARRIKWTAVSQ